MSSGLALLRALDKGKQQLFWEIEKLIEKPNKQLSQEDKLQLH
jgi:hypothetical protein